ncbi:GM24140 [Drosophila sechellia]|uniref:GM24140 n=1 Tax=Drosophila sechellia TaxID=7238 RepID=B4HF79_DROSE|nr:GM24140 [Drosophila sechellia]
MACYWNGILMEATVHIRNKSEAIEKQEHSGLRSAWAQVVEESSQDRVPEKSATCGCSNFPTAKTRIMPHLRFADLIDGYRMGQATEVM